MTSKDASVRGGWCELHGGYTGSRCGSCAHLTDGMLTDELLRRAANEITAVREELISAPAIYPENPDFEGMRERLANALRDLRVAADRFGMATA